MEIVLQVFLLVVGFTMLIKGARHDPKIKDDLIIIKNDNQHELEVSMKKVLDILEDNV